MIVIFGVGFFLLLGIGFCVSPKTFAKADQKDNPEAIEQIKKLGPVFIGFALFCAVFALKYS